ncbi:MAG: hypothetical protein MHPDNHAH_00563 [Anaerolineales bacterium]|nr:hypothetical protein [Anaerolineales bacterium]WKZ43186.1 MAG: DUF3597 domain-containing protein [Anaerolineales bacterium]
MSFFSKILGKLGIGKKEEDKPQFAGMAKPAGVVKGSAPAPAAAKPAGAPGAMARHEYAKDDDASPAPAAMAMVDVVAKLEGLAQANPAKLNWKVSIVDLLKLLDLESSFEARKELATELGCPADLMGDSAKMNTWLHKEVLRKIAANGGNIPKELLD